MSAQADTAARDKLLDELLAAVAEWAAKEEAKVQSEILFVKSVRSRSGSDSLSRGNTKEAQILVVDDINSFLAGI